MLIALTHAHAHTLSHSIPTRIKIRITRADVPTTRIILKRIMSTHAPLHTQTLSLSQHDTNAHRAGPRFQDPRVQDPRRQYEEAQAQVTN